MARWIDPEPQDSTPLDSLGLPTLVSRILMRRGISDIASARRFLDPDLTGSTPWPAIEPTIDRILEAVLRHQPICVWGDFDVDGQTSTAVLVQALRILGADVSYYVPVRANEGHGVHISSLESFLNRGVRLVITCDTGMSAHDAVEYGKRRGAQFIITDHHEFTGAVPDAFAVLNPKLLAETHPLVDLAGVGVAYKLAEGLLGARQLESAALLDLVGLGLIADVARLRRETRVLAQKGIRAIRSSDRLALRLIAESGQAELAAATEETIGFTIAPRLNAVGRLSDANAAVELLLTEDPVRARVLTAQTEGLNTQRKLLTEQVFQAAEAQIRADPTLLTAPVLVLEHASWPGGVLGIVAARLVELHRRPAIVLTTDADGISRGSARSVDGVDITRAISACREILLDYGGHPMAAGLSLRTDSLSQFRLRLQRGVEKMLSTAYALEDTLQIEEWLSLGDLTIEMAKQLEQLAPFGAGNAVPVFAVRNVHIVSSRTMGASGESRSLMVADEPGVSREVVWWNAGEHELPEGRFDLAFSVRSSAYRSQQRLAIQLIELRPLEHHPIDVKPPHLEVVDLRAQGTAAKLPPSCLLWAEGRDARQGSDRFHLSPSEELAIWTAPPSRHELRAAIADVRPKRVYLVATVPLDANSVQSFLARLTGLTKFVLAQRGGRTSVAELAAASAQRELTVSLGLEWLAARGHLRVQALEDGIQLTAGDVQADVNIQHELYAGIKGMIDETVAYRQYVQTADATSLL